MPHGALPARVKPSLLLSRGASGAVQVAPVENTTLNMEYSLSVSSSFDLDWDSDDSDVPDRGWVGNLIPRNEPVADLMARLNCTKPAEVDLVLETPAREKLKKQIQQIRKGERRYLYFRAPRKTDDHGVEVFEGILHEMGIHLKRTVGNTDRNEHLRVYHYADEVFPSVPGPVTAGILLFHPPPVARPILTLCQEAECPNCGKKPCVAANSLSLLQQCLDQTLMGLPRNQVVHDIDLHREACQRYCDCVYTNDRPRFPPNCIVDTISHYFSNALPE